MLIVISTTGVQIAVLAPLKQLLLLVLFVCLVVHQQGVDAIDPEYELNARLNQVFGAIVNTYLRPRWESRTPGNDSVVFRCRNSIDSDYVVVAVNADGGGGGGTDLRQRLSGALDLDAPVAVLVHGWFDSHDRVWFERVASAYQRHVGGNFCTVDWGILALTKYSLAAQRTRHVAHRLAQFLRDLHAHGVPMGSMTLIGHSFGAQIAGLAGGQLHGAVGRIFGLDPAGWLFTKPFLLRRDQRLDRSDAQFVQCVHTARNVLGLGSGVECGHQDVYPNGGWAPQPGCLRPREDGSMTHSTLVCSHFKSVQYFISSLDPANRFKARSCPSGYDDWKRGLCAANKFDYLGVHTRKRISGRLFLRTASTAPFVVD